MIRIASKAQLDSQTQTLIAGMANKLKKVKHILFRAGFGEPYPILLKQQNKSLKQVTEGLFQGSKKVKTLKIAEKIAPMPKGQSRTPEQRKEVRRMDNQTGAMVRDEWMSRMAHTTGALREKMTLFWHDHFACRIKGSYRMQLQYNLFHTEALGSFRTLLHSIAKDPGMLVFLNNAQNRKGHPNENFAREVMELFTLGRGHYSEKDIQEAARAFTGWATTREHEYVFKQKHHDFGSKTIFGKTGPFSGEEVLDMLLEDRQTARYISGKLYKQFVNDKGHPEIEKILAKQLYESDYNLEGVMKTMFTADWFFDEANIGTRIKSPTEYVAGMMRTLGVSFANQKAMGTLQRMLGQELFRPPNVAGWPGGRTWIDSTTLLIRLKLPDFMFKGIDFPYANKEEGDAMDTAPNYRAVRRVKAEADWGKLNRHFKAVKDNDLSQAVSDLLIQPEIDPKRLEARLLGDSREERLKSYIINAMSLPEYQLC